jgi:hypothetical protein
MQELCVFGGAHVMPVQGVHWVLFIFEDVPLGQSKHCTGVS